MPTSEEGIRFVLQNRGHVKHKRLGLTAKKTNRLLINETDEHLIAFAEGSGANLDE